jgi:hypothetical protein
MPPDEDFFRGARFSGKTHISKTMIFKILSTLLLAAQFLHAGQSEIRIEFPNGGESLVGGGEVRILWRSSSLSGDLAILLFRGGEQYSVIAGAVPDRGWFLWKVPPGLPPGGAYRLRICSLRDLRVNDFSDRDFAIRK